MQGNLVDGEQKGEIVSGDNEHRSGMLNKFTEVVEGVYIEEFGAWQPSARGAKILYS